MKIDKIKIYRPIEKIDKVTLNSKGGKKQDTSQEQIMQDNGKVFNEILEKTKVKVKGE